MGEHKTPPGHFARVHEKLAERVDVSLRDFLGRPETENTHALRGAIRRLQASVGVLPKVVRKERLLKEYRFRCERLFKLTSKIRNLDILEGKLAEREVKEGVAGMRKRIGQEREKAVRRSMKAAWNLFELRIPRVDEKEFAGCGTSVRKVLNDLDTVIGRELPMVADDETKMEKLHSLRKHFKKFRYTFELMPRESYKSGAPELLQRWQDWLGAIRDSDVMISYLERSGHPAATKPLLAAERVVGHRRYLAFVESFAGASAGSRLSLVACRNELNPSSGLPERLKFRTRRVLALSRLDNLPIHGCSGESARISESERGDGMDMNGRRVVSELQTANSKGIAYSGFVRHCARLMSI